MVNKLAQGGLVALSDSLVDKCLATVGWLVVEVDNNVIPENF